MKSEKELKALAEKITNIEIELINDYDPDLICRIEKLIKGLDFSELIQLDEEIKERLETFGQM